MPADMYSDRDVVTRKVAYTLYLCHLLSTWNARMYEFATVIFTAAAFPKDLTASSILCVYSLLSWAILLENPA
jgi:solute carrier family 40 (iron-regulated transporter), member 1